MATVSVEEHGLATNIKEYVPLMFELVQSNPAVIAWVVYEWPTGETSKSFDEAWTSIAPVPVKVAFKIAVESDPSEREMLATLSASHLELVDFELLRSLVVHDGQCGCPSSRCLEVPAKRAMPARIAKPFHLAQNSKALLLHLEQQQEQQKQ